MTKLSELIAAMLALLPSAAALRAIYCILKMSMNEEEYSTYRQRLINLLVFVVIAECAMGLLYVVLYYVS